MRRLLTLCIATVLLAVPAWAQPARPPTGGNPTPEAPVVEADLDASNSPTDEFCLTYESAAGGDFEWQACAAGGGTNLQINTGGNLVNADFQDGTDILWSGASVVTATINVNAVALGTDTTGDYVDDVTGGNGISVTHTPGEGSAPAVAVLLKTVGEDAVGVAQSVSGLEFDSGGRLTLLQGCADNEILKWDEAQDDWNCEADGGGFTPNADPGVDHSSYVAGHGDGANCAAGEIPLGVGADGAVQGCYEPTEADISDLSHTTPGGSPNEIQYNNAGSFGGVPQMDFDGTNLNVTPVVGDDVVANEVVNEVRNETGDILYKCTPVYLTGVTHASGVPQVDVADADAGNMPAVGIMRADLATGATGFAIEAGELRAADTATTQDGGWSVGDALYIDTAPTKASADCGEALTKSPPTGEAAEIQKVAIVTRVDGTNGTLEAVGAGRTNATPNLDSAAIFVGSATNQAAAVDVTGDVTISNTGVTTVADNSHNHTASNISDQNAGTNITADLEEEGVTCTDCIDLAKLDDDAGSPTAGDFLSVRAGATDVSYVTPNAGTNVTADLEEEGQINATAVTGNSSATDEVMLGQGANTAIWVTMPNCTDEAETLGYDAATNAFECNADAGAGGGMTSFDVQGDDGAPNVTITDGNVLTVSGGSGITTEDGDAGADTLDVAFAPAEVLDATFGDGAELVITWTFNQDGVNDPTFAFDDDSVVVTNAATFDHEDNSIPVADLNTTVTQAELDALSGTNTGDEALSTGSAGLDVSDHAVDLDVTPGTGSATLEQSDDALQVKYLAADFTEDANGLNINATNWEEESHAAEHDGVGTVDNGEAIDTASQEAGFLEDGGVTSLTCGASNQGKMQVMDDGALQYCDGATTSLLKDGYLDDVEGDDDVPESGDFGAAADLEGTGALSANTVDGAEIVDDAVDTTELDDTEAPGTGQLVATDNATATRLEYIAVGTGLTHDGDTLTADLGTSVSFITPAEVVDECAGGESLRRNGGDTAWECFTAAAGGGAFSDAGDPVVLNTTTKDVNIGTTHNNTAKLSVDGDADQVQFTVQGNVTQTDSIVIVETSAGAEILNVDNDGDVKSQSIQDIDGPGTNWSITSAGAISGTALTLGANENITLGAQTLDHDGTDFVFNDQVNATSFTTGAVAAPLITLLDSGFNGEGKISLVDATGPESQMLFQVDVGAGTDTTMLELDGVGDVIEIGNPGTNYVSITTAGVMTFAGTASIDLPNNTVVTADITDLNVTENKLAASLVFDASDDINIGDAFLEIPNGTAPVVSGAAGRIALDTDDNQLIIRSTSDIVVPTRQTKCASIENLAAADEIVLWLPDDAITVTQSWCSCLGANCTTPAEFFISDDVAGNDATGDVTCSDYPTADSKTAITGTNTFTAFEPVVLDVNNTPTADGAYIACFEYTTTRE